MKKYQTSKFHRVFALLLCFAMFISMVPVIARAEEPEAQAVSGIVIAQNITIPEYATTGDNVSQTMEYDCGNGVSGKGEKSYLTIVTGTPSSEFTAYLEVLKNAGYNLVSTNNVDARDGKVNQFATFTAPDGSYKVYTYHLPAYEETRIIVDTQKDTVAGFSYTPTGESVQPMIVQYGLSMSENGYDNTTTTAYSTNKRNCGALIVIRMPDNSLFIHDGGDLEQWSDEACDRFLQFCRELTGKAEGEKMVINTWFISHAHTDHYLGLPRFFSKHHDQFDLKNIMYNIDIERTYTTRDIHEIMTRVSSYYPNVKYYKPHTGESFNIAGIDFDVIYSHEDRYVPNANGELITDYPEIKDGKTVSEYDLGGTYRDYSYATKGDPTTKSDFNDTSTVLRVHMDENTDALLYADMNRSEQFLFDIYPDSALETDIMMIPHHGFDSHPKLCELSKAKIFLFTQHRGAIYGEDGILNDTEDESKYRPKLYKNYIKMQPYIETDGSKTYWAGNETVCLTVGNSASGVPGNMTKAEAPAGFTAYTADAVSFEYEGWSVDGSDNTSVNGEFVDAFHSTTTNTHTFRFDQVTDATLEEGLNYVIVHSASNTVLLHDAVAQLTSGQHVGSAAEFEDGTVNFFYHPNEGNVKLYFPHYYRDQAVWKILNNFVHATSARKPLTSVNPKYGGTSAYRYTTYTKGKVGDEGFWYTAADDTNATTSLQPNYIDGPTIVLPQHNSQNTYTEFFDDGTCVIYYYKDSTDIRFLFCDENGNWGQKRYNSTTAATNKTNIGNDLPNLKLRLYKYYEARSDMQTISYKGVQEYSVLTTVSQTETSALIGSGVTVMDTSRHNYSIPFSGTTPKVGYYHIEFPAAYKAGQPGDYVVMLQYRNDDGTDTQIGSVVLHVVDQITITGSRLDMAGTVSKNAGIGAVPVIIDSKTGEANPCRIEVTINTAEGHVTRMIPLSLGMLTDSNGNHIDTSIEGTYPGLTITYQGVKLNGTFTLTVTASNDALNYPLYPEEGSVRLTKQGITTLGDFMKTGVANIQLSATGKPTSNGVDLIVVMDLSGSMEYGLSNTVKQENHDDTRLHAMEESLIAMVKMLRESDADVRIAMSDFGDLDSHEFEGAVIDKSIANKPFFDLDFNNAFRRMPSNGKYPYIEFSNYLNFPMKTGDLEATSYPIANSKFNISNPSYTGKVVPTIYTGSKEANPEAFVPVAKLDDAAMQEIVNELKVNITHSIGTNYDVGLEYAYHLGMAIQQDNIDKGQDRDIVVIFMSDGAPMQFNYFAGRQYMTTWSDWITGNADGIQSLNYTEKNPPAGLEELKSAMLDLLKAGKLQNPTYRRDSGKHFSFDKSDWPDAWNGTDPLFPYFYTYMDHLGYDLDWQYLVDIAKVNDFPDFDYDDFLNNKMLDDLTKLLKAGDLVNPYYDQVPQYYEAYSGEKDDFFAAMDELGYDVSWDLFAKIAFKNRNFDREGNPVSEDAAGSIGTLLKTLVTNLKTTPNNSYATLSPYAYFYNENGLNWWAEAIKGKSTELYPVINKYAFTNSTERPFAYYGDVRNNFSGKTTEGLPLDGQNYIGGFRGLDADIYSVSFSIATEYELAAEEAELVMKRIATGPAYFFAANTLDGLTSALKAIATTISNGASRAWYIDTMGPDFDLSTSKTVKDPNGETIVVNADPTIRVLEYDVDETGYRTGVPNDREVVKFESAPDGSDQVLKAWSDQVYTTVVENNQIKKVYSNIWGEDGIIRAKSFYYNTNAEPVRVDLTGDGVPDYPVPGESFLWIIGVIGETEIVLDYQVYLTGSKDSKRDAGLYDTNAHAELQYINYLGNNCVQEVDSPKYPWDKGSVGYAFYLVDKYGNPVINEETGTTGTFELSVELTDIIYELFEMNNQPKTISAQEVMDKLVESGQMPEGYRLFDPTTSYTVTVNPSADPGKVNGTYKVDGNTDLRSTTWISGLSFDDVLPQPGVTNEVTDASTANTIVWFAVCVDVKTNPDSVVIDYGIPVNISVMANDSQMLPKYAELAGIGAYREPGYTEDLLSGFSSTFIGKFGTATVIDTDADEAVIRYALNTSNGMQMSEPEKFTYAVDYNGHYSEHGFYYQTITIIPAANIYYEDNYLEFTDTTLEDHDEGMGEWQTAYDTSTISVSCFNAGNWDEVYAYCKDDSGPAGIWPGVKMSDSDHDGIFTASVSADQIGKSVLFNNGDKKYQTADLLITDNGIYKVNNSWRTNEETTVYFNNADGWDEVSAYWWTGSENNGWPGTVMTLNEETGLYSINVPANMTNIIFNNNDNGIQTGDLSIVDEGVYQPNGSCTVKTTSANKTVYFDTENCPWDQVYAYWWNDSSNNGWPGTKMTLDEETGLYSISVPGNMTNIIFTNNKTGDGYNLGEQTIEKDGDVYCDLRWEYSTADVEVIFNNTDNWENVYAYYWSYGNTTMTSWPGIKMIPGENGLYTGEIPVNAENIIFSNGSSLKQTPDLHIGAVGTIYFPDGSQSYDNSAKRTYYFSGDKWDKVYAYAWDEFNNNNGNWPGQEMTYDPVTKLYSIEITQPNLTYIKFTNNSGSETGNFSIPASGSIYHGDNWVSYDGDPIIQEEDRPGSAADALKHIDADNVYGYDPAYKYSQLFSMDSARYVTVDASTGSKNVAPSATFTFTGTGFDVVSLTDSDCGAIMVEVVNTATNTKERSYIVNNFYGMVFVDAHFDENGNYVEAQWKVVEESEKDNYNFHLYQVPVMKVTDLDYGTHKVTIKAAYLNSMDKDHVGKYTIWLDAIRIYNPAKQDDTTVNDAYQNDGENNAHLTTVKKLLLSAADFVAGGADGANGVMYVEGKGENVSAADYANQGPNNETYLKNGNGIAFKLRYQGDSAPSINVHLGAKLALGSSATLNYNGNALTTLTTATNMFYDLGSLSWTKNNGVWESKAIVISCTAGTDAILSLTDLKVTGTDAAKIEGFNSNAALTAQVDSGVLKEAQKYMGVDVEIEPVTITGKSFSLSFEDEILVNFYYEVSDLTNVTEQGMLVFNTDPGTADITKADQKYDAPVYMEADNLYACTTSGIAASEMGDDRYYCAYAKLSDGTIVYSKLSQYSPKQYAMSRLEKSENENLKALCVAMLNYGAAAQNYFGYKTDALMNAGLSDAQKALVGAYDAELFTGTVAADPAKVASYFTPTASGFKRINASVSFEGAFALNFYFQLDREDTEVVFYYWTKEAYENADELSGTNSTGHIYLTPDENGIFHAPITGIPAKSLDDTFYVAATYTVGGESFCSGVIAYSLSSYCMKHANGDMGALSQATAMYGYYAECYFG